MSELNHAGGCLCGAVRYLAGGEARNLCYCHCVSCRRATGCASVPWATFVRARFRLTAGMLTEYRSSAAVLRGCCNACGTPLTYRNDSRPAEIDVTLASLDEAAGLAPTMHVWVAEKLPWVVLADELPRHPRGAGS